MDKIAALSKEKEEINARQLELEEERTGLQETITKQSDKRYKCEIEISKIDTNLENMRLRIDEAYQMDYYCGVINPYAAKQIFTGVYRSRKFFQRIFR